MLVVVGVGLAGCTFQKQYPEYTERMHVEVRLPAGATLPGVNDPPLPLPQSRPVAPANRLAMTAPTTAHPALNSAVTCPAAT